LIVVCFVVVFPFTSHGLRFLTSSGDLTCRNNPGSYGYYQQDANLFASWGVDYVKMDWCGNHRSVEGHKQFSHYLNLTGRPIVLELCRGPYQTGVL
jgi:alpha-galactosidase